ncbi:MAG: Trm112 family protein [Armatimonadota bacterium]
MLNPILKEILACPACEDHPRVRIYEDRIICDKCKRVYAITNGIPVMLIDEAETMEESC